MSSLLLILLQCDENIWICHVCGTSNHWVAYAIKLFDERIIVYDSMEKVNCWERIKSTFIPLSRIVPRLLMIDRKKNEYFENFTNLIE